MRILFDQGTPAPLRRALSGHAIETVYERGWSTLKNGVLLAAAEQAGFEVLVTTDQQLRYQQNLLGRHLAIVVLETTSWPRIGTQVARVQTAIDACTPGSYHTVPFDPIP
jgi:predicted nuclease of predicted toxin-antitoxin system